MSAKKKKWHVSPLRSIESTAAVKRLAVCMRDRPVFAGSAIRRNVEPFPKALNHRHAQFPLAAQHLADAAWRSEQRDKIGPGQIVLVHQVGQDIGRSDNPARPAIALIGFDQARLCAKPRFILGIVRGMSVKATNAASISVW